MAFVKVLEQLDSREAAGSKAVNLGLMLRAGLPVPRGFCVLTSAFKAYLAPQQQWVDDKIHALAGAGLEHVRLTAVEVQERLKQLELPEAVIAEISAALAEIGEERAFAVRSSATAEDLKDASFAGLYDSYLEIRGLSALLDAVRECFISVYNDRALSFRLHRGMLYHDVQMAAVVQQMVPAQAAGVLFTQHPVLDKETMLVEAVRGLGEGVVGGMRAPYGYVLRRPDGGILERHAGDDTDEPLSPAAAAQLASLCLRAERLFDGPQDIEWALVDGQLFLLQARPIVETAGRKPRDPAAIRQAWLWSNEIAAETVPGVATPFTWSIFGPLMIHALNTICKPLGVTYRRPDELLGRFDGRIYYNFTRLGQLFLSLPGARVEPLWQFLGLEPGLPLPQAPRRISRRRAIVAAPRLMIQRLTLGIRAIYSRWRIRRLRKRLVGHTIQQLDCHALRRSMIRVAIWQHTVARIQFIYAVEAVAAYIIADGLLHWAARRNKLAAQAVDLLDAIAGFRRPLFAKPAYDLCRLAQLAARDPALAIRLMDGQWPEAPHTTVERKFLREWRSFLRRYGHLAVYGVELANPRWRERHAALRSLLAALLRLGISDTLPGRGDKLRNARRRAANRFLRRISWLAQLPLLTLAEVIRGTVANRERYRGEMLLAFDLLRGLARESGQRLADAAAFAKADDAFFMSLESLAGLTPWWRGPVASGRLRTMAINLRRYHEYLKAPAPPPAFVEQNGARQPIVGTGDDQVLRGIPAARGKAVARVRVIHRPEDLDSFQPGEILVAVTMDIGFSPFLMLAAGAVADVGNLLSATALMAREFDIPAVVDTRMATRVLTTGDLIEIDGVTGTVHILPADRRGSDEDE